MILILWASPNTNGLTADVKNHLAQGVCNNEEQVESIQLNACALKACRVCGDGWGTCRGNGTCVIKDDFRLVYEKMMAADGIVIVTPVYWHDMAEPLKVLLDRVRRCETKFNHKLRDKKCLLVACPGGSGRGGIQCLMKMEEVMGHMGLQTVDRLAVNQFNKGYMLPALEEAGNAFAALSASKHS